MIACGIGRGKKNEKRKNKRVFRGEEKGGSISLTTDRLQSVGRYQ